MKYLTVMTLFSSLLLAACGDTTDESSAASAEIAASTPAVMPSLPTYQVRIANEPYPPFNIFMPDHTFQGLETDVLEAIGKQQGFHVKMQPYVWNVIFKDLKQSDSHMVGGGLVDEDFDLDELVLSQSYMRSPDCVVATHSSRLKDWYKRRVVTVLSDELDEDLVKDYQVKPNLIQNVRTQYQALDMVLNKKADVTISDCHVLKHYIYGSLKHRKFAIQELPIDEDDTSYDLVFGVRKDETELLKKINAGIEQLKQSGEMDKIIKKWTSEQNQP